LRGEFLGWLGSQGGEFAMAWKGDGGGEEGMWGGWGGGGGVCR